MKKITKSQYENHDCHKGRDSSCETCIVWRAQDSTLREIHHMRFPEILDDDLPDAYDAWIEELSEEELDEALN